MSRIVGAVVFVLGTVGIACGTPAPQPPTVTPPGGAEAIAGTERIGWDQRAGDNAELATLRYAIYVDNVRSELAGATCDDIAGDAGYTCSAPLPRLSAGTHTLELATFVQDGGLLESARSAALRVTVTGATTPSDSTASAHTSSTTSAAAAAAAWPASAVRLASGLDRPTDLAFLPDGVLLVAERSGVVRVARGAALTETPALVLRAEVTGGDAVLALAVDPQFTRTHFVFAIYTARSPAGVLGFTLARFREAAGTLADEVVLLDGVRASAEPHASLRFGPDGKLYAAFDDGGDRRLALDPASFNSKILRLNPDGTTPADQPRGSPVLMSGVFSPRGIEWHRLSNHLWTADTFRVGGLHWPTPPTALAAKGDDLFVASEGGLRRARLDRLRPGWTSETTDVVSGLPVDAVAVGPDGGIVFTAGGSLGRIAR